MLNDNKQTNKFSNVHAGKGIVEIKKEAERKRKEGIPESR